MQENKITFEGQPCKKCQTPVIKKVHKANETLKARYFAWWFSCPKCHTTYLVPEAERRNQSKSPFTTTKLF